MNDRSIEVFCLLTAALVLLFAGRQAARTPAPDTPAARPRPLGPPDDEAKRRRRPWLPWRLEASVGGPVSPAGARVQCELPGELHRRNTASKGLGNCVFTSLHHAALWQNVPQLQEFPKWLIAKGIPGGGYPQKVEQLIPKICADRGLPVPDYLQVQSNDLEVLRRALKGGRMVSCTYGRSFTGRYGGRHIDHMVNLVHLDDKHGCVLDNNYPGENQYEWLSTDELARAYKDGSSAGWSVILLTPPPAPRPKNRTQP